MKQFIHLRALREHRLKNLGCKRKTGVEKNRKANKKQLPKPDDKSAKRKGVRLQITFFTLYVQFDMEMMRKMRDKGKFKNSTLAEIERNELLAKMTQQVDEIQDDLEKKILDIFEKAECQDLPLDKVKKEIRDDWLNSGRLGDYL